MALPSSRTQPVTILCLLSSSSSLNTSSYTFNLKVDNNDYNSTMVLFWGQKIQVGVGRCMKFNSSLL